ncbi:MAG: dienelactone hydrolase family protein [Gammaproteobacteria bacterium]
MDLTTFDAGYTCEQRPYDLYVARLATLAEAPLVLVCPAWDGLNEPVKAITRRIAALGYQAVAIDVYGHGVRGEIGADNSALMNPLLADRTTLTARLLAATAAAQALPGATAGNAVAIGYCFGGLAVLDLVRANAAGIGGVVSFHGLLIPNDLDQHDDIGARVLVEHGWDDPMVPPEQVLAFAREMDARGADWQLHAHGGAMHAFTFEGANAPEMGVQYHAAAAARSWQSMLGLFAEVFPDDWC